MQSGGLGRTCPAQVLCLKELFVLTPQSKGKCGLLARPGRSLHPALSRARRHNGGACQPGAHLAWVPVLQDLSLERNSYSALQLQFLIQKSVCFLPCHALRVPSAFSFYFLPIKQFPSCPARVGRCLSINLGTRRSQFHSRPGHRSGLWT